METEVGVWEEDDKNDLRSRERLLREHWEDLAHRDYWENRDHCSLLFLLQNYLITTEAWYINV